MEVIDCRDRVVALLEMIAGRLEQGLMGSESQQRMLREQLPPSVRGPLEVDWEVKTLQVYLSPLDDNRPLYRDRHGAPQSRPFFIPSPPQPDGPFAPAPHMESPRAAGAIDGNEEARDLISNIVRNDWVSWAKGPFFPDAYSREEQRELPFEIAERVGEFDSPQEAFAALIPAWELEAFTAHKRAIKLCVSESPGRKEIWAMVQEKGWSRGVTYSTWFTYVTKAQSKLRDIAQAFPDQIETMWEQGEN